MCRYDLRLFRSEMATYVKLKTASQVHAELMPNALHAVRKDGMSLREAARRFTVPRSSLYDRMKNPNPKRVGAPTKFPKEEEARLAEFLMECSDRGIPLNRNHCSELISQLGANFGKTLILLEHIAYDVWRNRLCTSCHL